MKEMLQVVNEEDICDRICEKGPNPAFCQNLVSATYGSLD